MSQQKYVNKVVIITGSAGGLGKEFARRLLEQGANVCLSDVNQNLVRKMHFKVNIDLIKNSSHELKSQAKLLHHKMLF